MGKKPLVKLGICIKTHKKKDTFISKGQSYHLIIRQQASVDEDWFCPY